MTTIEIKNVSKLYGKQQALDSVSLVIGSGEVVGLLGPNGAGKSTLMKILTSFIPPSSGYVMIKGMDVEEESLKIRKHIGYLPENNPLYLDMYVREYLSFVLGMYDFVGNKIATINNVIELTGLGPEQKKVIGTLSKGYRQRVGLAQALIHNPEILILDEPTSGLDPNQLVDIRKIISDLGREKTVILSTHIMQEVEAICGRVVIMNNGLVVADDKTTRLSKLTGTSTHFKVEFKEKVSKAILLKLPFINKVSAAGEKTWLIESNDEKDIRQELFQFAVDNKYNVLSLSQEEKTMEDIFRGLTRI